MDSREVHRESGVTFDAPGCSGPGAKGNLRSPAGGERPGAISIPAVEFEQILHDFSNSHFIVTRGLPGWRERWL